ncbi:hypothetical protein CUMW_249590 [Citrus unshiu]|uniref:Pre-mRNA-splicing factor ISY1-like protein n=1 Tax=Citrus unshiu TaxID=55188 RepID=A0A2H5QPL0_CITUN|nr:hypothetical protein CUMW_249590 [Citrus unshiu]
MARNEEKAQSMLNRYIALQAEEKKKPKERRPYLASECRDLSEADKWRQQIMREIGRKVAEIQNEGLGEHRLRDLNDEINKLIREKGHWERRIFELGGPNYTKHFAKMTDLEGNIVDVPNPSGRGPGYRYFGAAKKLPGVRELFEKPPELRKRRTRYDIYKRIDASYYGYRDDEDGVLERVEGPAEREMRAKAVQEWRRLDEIKKEAMKTVKSGEEASVMGQVNEILKEGEEDVVLEERMREMEIERKEKEREFVVHVPLPDDKEIEKMVIERKKMELLKKYATEEFVEEQNEAKAMLNIQHFWSNSSVTGLRCLVLKDLLDLAPPQIGHCQKVVPCRFMMRTGSYFIALGKIDKAISCLTYNLKMAELIEVQGSESGLKLVRFQLKNAERGYYLGIVVKNLL